MAAELNVKLSSSVQAPPATRLRGDDRPGIRSPTGGGLRDFTCPEVIFDVRVGGAYRIAMQPPEGELFHLVGEYVEVSPPSRLAYTFRWEPPDPDDQETLARLTLRERGGATEIELTHGPFATEARRDLHEAGWSDTLARLARHLTLPT